MQELEYNDIKKDYTSEIDQLRQSAEEAIQGVKVKVIEDFKHGTVELSIAGRETILTIQGARDLAIGLHQAANRVEKNSLLQGFKPSEKRR